MSGAGHFDLIEAPDIFNYSSRRGSVIIPAEYFS